MLVQVAVGSVFPVYRYLIELMVLTMSRLLREPFLHFLLLGALIFLYYELSGSEEVEAASTLINVTAEDIDLLRQQWRKQHGEEANAETMQELLESLVYQEVMAREALRLGLDVDDTIIRRRLVQKMEFLSANHSRLEIPNEEDLLAFFNEHSARYALAEKRSFTHIYFSRDRRGENLLKDAGTLLVELQRSGQEERSAGQGDNFILQYKYKLRSMSQVSRTFGEEFARELFSLPVNAWSGPVLSEYGAHLVRIQQVMPAHTPEFENIRSRVYQDLVQEKLERLKDETYQDMRQGYQVRIEKIEMEGS